MQSGLLWYDNSNKTLAEKIIQAANRYERKFGVPPDTCFVNPNDAPSIAADEMGAGICLNPQSDAALQFRVRIKVKTTILPNHLWLGVSKPATETL